MNVYQELIEAGAENISDSLTQLGVDPDERPEHGGPTTAEVLAASVLRSVPEQTVIIHTTPEPADNQLRSEIKSALNRASAENGSDTPDHILADYLMGCLDAYNAAVQARDDWTSSNMTDPLDDIGPEPTSFVDIVFDGPPSHDQPKFIEVEDHTGSGVRVGDWVEREDGNWALRFPSHGQIKGAENPVVT